MTLILSLVLTCWLSIPEPPQSGQWIISNDENDIYLEEVGGCTGGPTIINFENQTIEMC